MKILQVHKYFTRKKGGGSVSAFFETKELLEKKGHQVIVFAMDNLDNEYSIYNKYFPSYFDINEAKTLFQKVRYSLKSIHNQEAVKNLEKLIVKERPDIAHIHNIYHYLTPVIFSILKKYNIPIVFKLSDYKPICPNYKLFVKGDICEACKDGKYYMAVRNKCLKDSYGVSLVAMIEAYYHKILKSYNKVDYFLAPSNFMIKKVGEFGISRNKIKLLRNVLNFSSFEPCFDKENFFSYVGRISKEKGLDTLLRAVHFLKKEGGLSDFKLFIVGGGPEEEVLKKLAKNLDILTEVQFKGFLQKGTSEWEEILKKSAFTVLPSIWYDNSPIAISESLAFGTPAIISDLGGTPEMIDDKKSGLIFKHKNVEDLADKIKYLIQNKDIRNSMSIQAVEKVQQLNDEEKYYNTLMGYYQELVNNKIQ